MGGLLLVLIALVPLSGPDLGFVVLRALFAIVVLASLLNVLVSRAVVADGALVLRSPLPRRSLRAPLGEVVRYAPDKLGRWWVETADRRVPVPVADPWEIHAALALAAPRTLAAKGLRPQHAPPTEEFPGLWVYDVESLLSETVVRVAIVLLLAAGSHGLFGLSVFLVAPFFFGLFEMTARLDVTDEGLVRRGPFHRRTILWSDAVAIFCEPPLPRRRFVVTGSEAAIEIPAHLARDLDLMRKVFRSLPEGTLLVNFDETTFRGYRRRKKGKEKAPQEDLMPALTA